MDGLIKATDKTVGSLEMDVHAHMLIQDGLYIHKSILDGFWKLLKTLRRNFRFRLDFSIVVI